MGDYRLDLLIEDTVVVEIKSVDRFEPVHVATSLTYLEGDAENASASSSTSTCQYLKDGIRRVVL